MSIEYTYPSQYPRLDAQNAVPCAQGDQACLFGADGLSFKDVLDVVNPLQQLPVIGNLYRAATGDSMSAFARMAGGALLGGPVGFIIAAASAGLEAATGSDVGEHLVAMVSGEGSGTQYAAAQYAKAQALG